MSMSQTTNVDSVFGIRLIGLRETLIRFALSTLVGGTRLWASLVIVMPLALLLTTAVHDSFIPIAAGTPIALCLWFLWLSHEFIDPTLSLDTDARELVLAKPYDNGEYSPIDVDALDCISVIRFTNVAMVQLHYRDGMLSKPLSTAVTVSSVPELIRQLKGIGVDVTVREYGQRSLSIDLEHLRVLGTPIVLGSIVIIIYYLYGTDAFLTNAVIIPAIVMIGYSIYGLMWQLRLAY